MTSDKRTMVRRTSWPRSVSSPVVTPLQTSVVYQSDSPDMLDGQYEGGAAGYTYSREGHPNAAVLAEKIDMMEGVDGGLIVSSGMAAVTAALLGCLKSGDHVIGGDQLYGRSLRLMGETLPQLGIATSLMDPTDVTSLRAALRPETKMVLVEVVSNPTLRVADMDGIAEVCAEKGVLLVVDNTFTTPAAFRAFEHGADIVIHSVTKLLAGHSDAMLGYVVAKDPDLRSAITTFAVTTGMTPSPFDCWMAERGLYSFDLRFRAASDNARRLAEHISGLPGVRRVLYPTRSDHPDHNRAVSLLGEEGGNMVSFEIEGGRGAANALTLAAKNIPFAPTLGDIGTTLSHPPSSSHRALSEETRAAIGITEGFFRVSVGVEPIDLLCDEFETAIRASQA